MAVKHQSINHALAYKVKQSICHVLVLQMARFNLMINSIEFLYFFLWNITVLGFTVGAVTEVAFNIRYLLLGQRNSLSGDSSTRCSSAEHH